MANATILYACTGDGLLIFNKPGTLNEWLPPRMVLRGQQVVAAWAEPGPPIRVVAATRELDGEGHVLLSENGGRDWESKLQAPVTGLLGLEGSPARLYAGLEGGGLAASVDGGLDWGILPGTDAGSIRRIYNMGEPDLFYLLADGEEGGVLLEGTPEEGNWRKLPIEGVISIAWDTEMGDLYAATARDLQMSADKGTTWVPLPSSPEGCTNIAVLPGPSGSGPSIVVSTQEDFLISNNAGASWQWVSFGPHQGVSAIVRDLERRDRLYAATSGGYIFESGNRGQAWQAVNAEAIGAVTALYVLRI